MLRVLNTDQTLTIQVKDLLGKDFYVWSWRKLKARWYLFAVKTLTNYAHWTLLGFQDSGAPNTDIYKARLCAERIDEVGLRVWVGSLDLTQVAESAVEKRPVSLPLTLTLPASQGKLARTLKKINLTLQEVITGITWDRCDNNLKGQPHEKVRQFIALNYSIYQVQPKVCQQF
jgi:hypothetical protein